nr:hypothetical protein [Streptomyces sp. DSM 110735]
MSSASAAGTSVWAAVAKEPSARWRGWTPSAVSTAVRAWRSAPITRSPCSTRTAPTGVGTTPPGRRSSSRAPSSASSLAICWDSADGVNASVRAASAMDPACATSTRTRSRFTSSSRAMEPS